jgi:hypothetical protein
MSTIYDGGEEWEKFSLARWKFACVLRDFGMSLTSCGMAGIIIKKINVICECSAKSYMQKNTYFSFNQHFQWSNFLYVKACGNFFVSYFFSSKLFIVRKEGKKFNCTHEFRLCSQYVCFSDSLSFCICCCNVNDEKLRKLLAIKCVIKWSKITLNSVNNGIGTMGSWENCEELLPLFRPMWILS